MVSKDYREVDIVIKFVKDSPYHRLLVREARKHGLIPADYIRALLAREMLERKDDNGSQR